MKGFCTGKMRILITGAQGSGKTTQANILSDKLGYPLIKMGDLLRDFAGGKGEDNKKIAGEMSRGEMVDDEVAAGLVKERVESFGENSGIIADGYPRRMHQLQTYDPHYDKVFNLKIRDEVGVERLLERGRGDDTPEAIQKRLSWYHKETEPVLEYYRKKGILIDIDGEQEIDKVTQDILRSLDEPESE